jgi:hypothetical protein
MFAKVENNQVVKVSSQLTDFIPFEHARVWDKAQREANGLYDVNYDTSNLKDEQFYINGAETIAFANGQVTATYGIATAKKLEDVNAVDQNGQPALPWVIGSPAHSQPNELLRHKCYLLNQFLP